MELNTTRITFDGMEPSDSLKQYVLDKLSKHQNFLDEAISLTVVLVEETHTRGVDKDFKASFNISIPNKTMHVEEEGEDMYKLIDEATDKLFRRLRKREEKEMDKAGL